MPSTSRKDGVENECKIRKWNNDQIRTVVFMVEFYKLSPSDIIACGIVSRGDDEKTRYVINQLHRSWEAGENPCGLTHLSLGSSSKTKDEREGVRKKVEFNHQALKGVRPTVKRAGKPEKVVEYTKILENFGKEIIKDMNGTSPVPATSANAGEGPSKRRRESTIDNKTGGSSGKKLRQAEDENDREEPGAMMGKLSLSESSSRYSFDKQKKQKPVPNSQYLSNQPLPSTYKQAVPISKLLNSDTKIPRNPSEPLPAPVARRHHKTAADASFEKLINTQTPERETQDPRAHPRGQSRSRERRSGAPSPPGHRRSHGASESGRPRSRHRHGHHRDESRTRQRQPSTSGHHSSNPRDSRRGAPYPEDDFFIPRIRDTAPRGRPNSNDPRNQAPLDLNELPPAGTDPRKVREWARRRGDI